MTCLSGEPELEQRVRALRLLLLGKKLAQLKPEHLSYVSVPYYRYIIQLVRVLLFVETVDYSHISTVNVEE